MNDMNKITEVDLNPDLLTKINNPAKAITTSLSSSGWKETNITTSDKNIGISDTMRYRYKYINNGIKSTSMVNVVFVGESRELALDYGLSEVVSVSDGSISFFSEELPEKSLNVIIQYIP